MDFKFVKNERACIIKKLDALIIGDLHLGIEKEYEEKGINIGNVYGLLQNKINELVEKYSIKSLIFLGDIKHQIMLSRNIKLNLLKFFGGLNVKEIHVVKGNHDGELEKILSNLNINIHSSRGFVLQEYGFFHGNSWPFPSILKTKYAFCSHLHPRVKLPESSKKFELDVFVVCKPNYSFLKKKYKIVKIKKIVILPPFNPFVGGISVNESFGILEKMCDFKSLEIYSIRGEIL